MEKNNQLLDEDTIIEAPVEIVQEEALDVQNVANAVELEKCDTALDYDCDSANEYVADDVEATDGEETEILEDCLQQQIDVNEPNGEDKSPKQSVDLSKIECMLEELSRRFEQKIANDAHKATLFDKMYDELQSYKTDIYAKILKPFVLSTITLIDDTKSFLGKLDENESQKAEKYLRGMPDDLVDILESNGVELYEDDIEVFNPRTQRAMKSVPTDNLELDKHIARRLRKGYRWNGTILRPELVQIYKYENK